jgi:hypothetical protein
MQITSTMLRRIAAMPEQAMGPCLLLLAEQLEVAEARRSKDRERKSAARPVEIHGNPRKSSGNPAEIHGNASRVDNLSSLSENVETVSNPLVIPPTPSEPPFFEAFWSAYPKRAGSRDRKGALKAFRAAAKRATPDLIIEGALLYANFCRLSDKEGTEFIKQARSWLNADGWTETYDIPRSTTNGTTIHDAWRTASAVLREQDRREGICREGGEGDFLSLPEPEGGA